jgi:hypothetical protein
MESLGLYRKPMPCNLAERGICSICDLYCLPSSFYVFDFIINPFDINNTRCTTNTHHDTDLGYGERTSTLHKAVTSKFLVHPSSSVYM